MDSVQSKDTLSSAVENEIIQLQKALMQSVS